MFFFIIKHLSCGNCYPIFIHPPSTLEKQRSVLYFPLAFGCNQLTENATDCLTPLVEKINRMVCWLNLSVNREKQALRIHLCINYFPGNRRDAGSEPEPAHRGSTPQHQWRFILFCLLQGFSLSDGTPGITIYGQCIQKIFKPLDFFHICYVAALF